MDGEGARGLTSAQEAVEGEGESLFLVVSHAPTESTTPVPRWEVLVKLSGSQSEAKDVIVGKTLVTRRAG